MNGIRYVKTHTTHKIDKKTQFQVDSDELNRLVNQHLNGASRDLLTRGLLRLESKGGRIGEMAKDVWNTYLKTSDEPHKKRVRYNGSDRHVRICVTVLCLLCYHIYVCV